MTSSNKRKLIVNWLPEKMTDEDLLNLFAPFGIIEHCNLVRNSEKKSLCYGFVTFEDESDAKNAAEALDQLNLPNFNKVIKVSPNSVICLSILLTKYDLRIRSVLRVPKMRNTKILQFMYRDCQKAIPKRASKMSSSNMEMFCSHESLKIKLRVDLEITRMDLCRLKKNQRQYTQFEK